MLKNHAKRSSLCYSVRSRELYLTSWYKACMHLGLGKTQSHLTLKINHINYIDNKLQIASVGLT